MATTSVTVKLADLGQVQNLVLAAARIIDGAGAEWIRATRMTHVPVATTDLVTLLAALEALEPAKT